MPIQGKFYTSKELQALLGVSRQRIRNLASEDGQDFLALNPGLYCAEDVEDYLMARGIDPLKLPVRTYDHPDGATLTELEAEYRDVYQKN